MINEKLTKENKTLTEICDTWKVYIRCVLNASPETINHFIELHELFLSTSLLICLLTDESKHFGKRRKSMIDDLIDMAIEFSSCSFEDKEKERSNGVLLNRKSASNYSVLKHSYSPRHIHTESLEDNKTIFNSLSRTEFKNLPISLMSSSKTSKPQHIRKELRTSFRGILKLSSDESVNSYFNSSHPILNHNCIDTYKISSALTYIDQRHLSTFKISDLNPKKRNVKWLNPILSQQEGLKNYILDSINNSKNPPKLVTHCIRICKHLKTQKNYNSLLTILIGLDSVSKDIWKGVSLSKIKFYKMIFGIYNMDHNYHQYRIYLKENIPIIPCIPILLKDCYLYFEHNTLFDKEKRSIPVKTLPKKNNYRLNDNFLSGIYQQYQYIKRSQELFLLGKIDNHLIKTLSFYN